MTEEAFLEQVSPIPEHDHFYFAKPDPSLGNNLYSRAYINFVNVDDIYLFKDKFDGYVFLDDRGKELCYQIIVLLILLYAHNFYYTGDHFLKKFIVPNGRASAYS